LFGLCKEGKLERTSVILDEMLDKGFTPDVFTYTIIIDALCKAGKLLQAKRTLEEMIMKGCPPNVVTYTSMIHGFCQEGDFHEANRILDEMLSNGCVPDVVTWSTLMNAFRGEIKSQSSMGILKNSISKIMDDMLDESLVPNAFASVSLLDFLCEDTKSAVKAILNEMGENNCIPVELTKNPFINRLFKEGKLHGAMLRYWANFCF